jgi:hypothetical protein
MWVFLSDAFLSIVAPDSRHPKYDETKDVLIVRARKKEDINRVFPDATVEQSMGRDYRYRAAINRVEVAQMMFNRVMDNNATNFKNTVHEDERHDAYNNVWEVMYNYQNNLSTEVYSSITRK